MVQRTQLLKLLNEPSRLGMLSALMSGCALTATELARHANVSAQVASNHLKVLQDAGCLQCITSGRYRYYRLINEQVASLIESLGPFEESLTGAVRHRSRHHPAFRYARTCYNHLAGQLGVHTTQGMLDYGWLVFDTASGFTVTPLGVEQFGELGIEVHVLAMQHDILCKPCLDCTERRYHLGGPLANALLVYWLEQRLLIRRQSPARALRLTSVGQRWFSDVLGV